MFLFGRKEVVIREYEKRSVSTPGRWMKEVNPRNEGSISFTSIKLHVAVSRAILSRDLFNLDLLFDVASSFLRYRALIDSRNQNLRLSREAFEALRDFSQKARLGELAQGIAMLFSQEFLRHPIFVDFHGFIKRKKPAARISGLTPDYIIQRNSDFNISLIESKGHYARHGSTKNKLAKGLKQCDNGKSILSTELPLYVTQKSYPLCFKIFDETDKDASEVQFIDPSEARSNDNPNLEVIQYHYASWFLLMGHFRLYDRLLNSQVITQEDIAYSSVREYFGRTFIMFEEKDFFLSIPYHLHFLSPPYIARYGILKEVLDILMGKSIRLSDVKFDLDYIEDQAKGVAYFYDGTILMQTENFW